MSDDSNTKSHSKGRSRSKSGGKKAALGLVAGAGAGGLLGHEILGGGVVGTVSGMLVGAMGAQALERRHERYGVRLFPMSNFEFSDCMANVFVISDDSSIFFLFSVPFSGAGEKTRQLCVMNNKAYGLTYTSSDF